MNNNLITIHSKYTVLTLAHTLKKTETCKSVTNKKVKKSIKLHTLS